MLSEKINKLTQFYKQDPSNVVLLNDLIKLYFVEDAIDELVDFGRTLEPELLSDPNISNQLGIAGLIIGDYDFALFNFEKAFETQPEDISIAYNLAYSKYALHRFEDSLSILHKLENKWLENPNTYLLLARCEHQLKNVDLSLKHIDLMIEIEPNNLEALGLKSLLLLDIGEYQQSKEIAEKVLQEVPDQLDATIAISASHIALGDLEHAMPWVERGIEQHNNVGRFWLNKGQIELLKMKMADAEMSFEITVQKMPDHIGSWHLLAWAQHLNNNPSRARHSFMKALEIDRNFADSHGALAMMDALEGKLDTAQTHLKRSLRLDPSCATGNYAKSLIMEINGDKRGAQELIEKIFKSETGENALSMLPFVIKQLESKE